MYNYEEAMAEDIREYIKENIEEDDERWEDREKLEQDLYDDLWMADSVTGNASGSYTFNSAQALEYLHEDGFERFDEVKKEFGLSADSITEHICNQDWEWFDVTIRCYLVSQVLNEVLDEIYDEREEAEQNEI